MSDRPNIAGGRGRCRKCGEIQNNVSLHETWCGEQFSPETSPGPTGMAIPEIIASGYPVTLIFGTREEADAFIALVKEANPGLEGVEP